LRKIIFIIALVSSLWSLDITEAVELGLAKKTVFMDTKQKLENSNHADSKLDIRLVYLKFLENREKMYIVDGAIKKLEKFKNSNKEKEQLVFSKQKIEKDFLDVKSLLESIIDRKIDDINEVKSINFSELKNSSLEKLIDKSVENSEQINSLESELNEHDSKKSNSSWNIDVSGDVRYRFDSAKRSDGRSFKSNEVELGVSVVLSKNSGVYENDSTIEIAKKRYDLEKQKANLKNDIKQARDEYVGALKEYKTTKENINQYDLNNLKTPKNIEEAYNSYMQNTEALYNTYRKYARLLYIIEKD